MTASCWEQQNSMTIQVVLQHQRSWSLDDFGRVSISEAFLLCSFIRHKVDGFAMFDPDPSRLSQLITQQLHERNPLLLF